MTEEKVMPREAGAQLGLLLRQLRRKQNKSQEEVAHASDIAHNYYGEIERGRREPARDTLLSIARHGLNLPVNQLNLLLLAGGFAPLPQPLTSTEMARLYKIVEGYLNKMSPYPSVLVNQFWNVLKWNASLPVAFGLPLDRISGQQRNWLRLLFDPVRPLRQTFLEWEAFARYQLALFQRSSLGLSGEPEYRLLIAELLKLPDFERLWAETHPGQAEQYLGQAWLLKLAAPLPQGGRVVRCRLVQTSFDQYSQLFALTFFPLDEPAENIFQALGQGL
jgi:transcriptional regulator with XRE-family HTH domain